MKLLVVAPRPPRANGKGDQIRLAQYLPELARNHEVTLVCPNGGQTLPAGVHHLGLRLGTFQRALGALAALLLGRPLQCGWFAPPRLRRTARRALEDCDRVLFVTVRPWIDPAQAAASVDHVDTLSLNAARRAGGRLAPLWRLESKRLARLERRVARRVDAQAVTSPVDAAALPGEPTPAVVPVGVAGACSVPGNPDSARDIDVIFTGNMSYGPNRDAAQWLACEIAPRLRERLPGIRVVIAGRAADTLDLECEGITVHSDVPSLEPLLRRAKVAVAPLRSGTGVPNKVLEAARAGASVVMTRELNAAFGFGSDSVGLASDTDDLAGEIELLLRSPALRGARRESLARELRRFRIADVAERIEQALARPVAQAARPSADCGRPLASVASQAKRLGATAVVGAGLNILKFALLAAALSARQLDLLTVGLLLAVTAAQVVGEALAAHAVTRPDGRRPDAADLLGGVFALVLGASALMPEVALGLLAPGLEPDSEAIGALRILSLAATASVCLWWAAGEAQRRLDFRGLQAINLVPNAAVVVALCLPVDDKLAAVAWALLAATAAAAVLVGAAAYRQRGRSPSGPPVARAAAAGLAALLALAVATQLNLVLVRVLGSFLPAGSLSAIYVAAGIAFVPAMAAGSSLAAVLLPRWAAGQRDDRRLANPLRAAATAACVAAALAGVLALAALAAWQLAPLRAHVDPTLLAGLSTALPILLAAVPLHAAATVLRAGLVAEGRTPLATGLGVAGALLVALGFVVSPTLAGVCVAYGLSTAPLALVAAWRALPSAAPLRAPQEAAA